MHSSARRESRPRTVSVPAKRLLATLIGVVALPLTLSACGLLGGGGDDQVPVVIPSDVADDGAAQGDTSSPSASPADTSVKVDSSDAADPAPPQNSTVTRTGIVVQKQTQTQTRTQTRTATATKTLPQVTVTQTPAPITVTETRTETRTDTRTVQVQLPAQTVTVTRTVAPPVVP